MKRDAIQPVEIRITQRLGAKPDRVFSAWVDAATAGQWLFATASRPVERVEIDARVGGRYRFVERRRGIDVVHAGEYTEIAPPHRLSFRPSARGNTHDGGCVSIRITALNKGCELTLIQEKVPPDEATRIEGRWSGMLYGLKTLLSTAPRLPRKAASRR